MDVGSGGCFGVLQGLFIGLKLTGVVDWSWWLVLAPTWIPLTIAAGIFAVLAFVVWKEE